MTACKYIQSCIAILGPCMYRYMAFRDDHNTTDSDRREVMKGGIDDGRSACVQASLRLRSSCSDHSVALGAIVEFNKQVVPHATAGHLPSFGQANVRTF